MQAEEQPETSVEDFDLDESQTLAKSALVAVTQLLERYREHLANTQEMLRLEWQLITRSLLVSFFLLLAFAVVLVGCWIGLMTTLAFGLVELGVSWWAVSPILFFLQVILLIWLWMNVKRLISSLGFKQSLNTLLGDFEKKQE